MSYNLRSLCLAGMFGLMLPFFIIAGIFSLLLAIGLAPALQSFSDGGVAQVVAILQTFGNGSLVEGGLVIAIASGVVSILFDACNLLILSKPIR